GRQSIQNACEDSFLIVENVVVPETQDSKALCREIGIANRVPGIPSVLSAVGLDDQSFPQAGEVDNIAIDGDLRLELQAREPLCAQYLPQAMFGGGRFCPHPSRMGAKCLFIPGLPNPSPALREERG